MRKPFIPCLIATACHSSTLTVFSLVHFHMARHTLAVASIAASQLQGPGIDPEPGLLSVRSCSCSLHTCFGFLGVLWFPLTVGFGYTKLPLIVSECVNRESVMD